MSHLAELTNEGSSQKYVTDYREHSTLQSISAYISPPRAYSHAGTGGLKRPRRDQKKVLSCSTVAGGPILDITALPVIWQGVMYCASHKNWIRNIRFSIMNSPLSR